MRLQVRLRQALTARASALVAVALVAVALVALAMPARDAGPVASADPIFGLPFTAEAIRFEPAPRDITTRCKDLVQPRFDRRLWVFAQATVAGETYYVLGGYYVARAGGALQADTRGVVARLDQTRCITAGPVRDVFESDPEEISPAARRALAADAMRRYAALYGGAAGLRATLTRADAMPDNEDSPILRQALDAAR